MRDSNGLWNQINDILGQEGYQVYDGYSGRAMYGSKSSVAFTTEYHPKSDRGEKLTELGLNYDGMGLEYVYYTRW